MAEIEKYTVISYLNDNLTEAIVETKVIVTNDSTNIIDDLALRLWIEGKNSIGEPIQMVLDENLYIVGRSISTLKGTLFNPVISTIDHPYDYMCRLQLIDSNDNILKEKKFSLSVTDKN